MVQNLQYVETIFSLETALFPTEMWSDGKIKAFVYNQTMQLKMLEKHETMIME